MAVALISIVCNLVDGPVAGTVAEAGLNSLPRKSIANAKEVDPMAIGAFLRSPHYAQVPTVQLSARLFAAYKESLRTPKTLQTKRWRDS